MKRDILLLISAVLVCAALSVRAAQSSAIVVLDVCGQGVSSDELDRTTDNLRNQFASYRYGVVSPHLHADVTDCFSTDCAVGTGREIGVGTVIISRVAAAGEFRTISIRCISVDENRIRYSVTRTCHQSVLDNTVSLTGNGMLGMIAGDRPIPEPVSIPVFHRKPPLEGRRILCEAVCGLGMGTYLAILGAYVLNDPDDQEDSGESIGIVLGYIIGNALGVYAVGNIGNQTGSLGWTMLGSSLGILGTVAFFVTVPAGALIAFNLTRHYRTTRFHPERTRAVTQHRTLPKLTLIRIPVQMP